jgi:hypothetical protein
MKQDSKSRFSYSKFPWAREITSLKITDYLGTALRKVHQPCHRHSRLNIFNFTISFSFVRVEKIN